VTQSPLQAFSGRVIAIVTLTLVATGCASSLPPPKDDVVTLTSVERAPEVSPVDPSPTRRRPESGMRVAMDDGVALFVEGHRLSIGQSEAQAREVLGSPTWTQDNPINQTAMSDTTYLFYSDRGLTVRIKHTKVEGFFVNFEPTTIEGHLASAAHPVLPHALPLDATVNQVVSALGEPEKRDEFALMDWLDLDYRVGDAIVDFHYEHRKLVSVALELPSS
jgi:hypothetical protein